MEEKLALSELRYLEQRLSDVMERVTERVVDEDVREGLEVRRAAALDSRPAS